jgi:hypothetical protein
MAHARYLRLHTHTQNNTYCFSTATIIFIIKSRRMDWAGHMARNGKQERIQGFGGETREKETA